MKFTKPLIAMVILISSIFSASCFAGLIVNIDGTGQLTDIQGLDVNGTLFDVSFNDGSCNSLFNNCTDFGPITDNPALAEDIAQALLAQLFISGSSDNGVDLGSFDTLQSNIRGCSSISTCLFLLPTKLGFPDGFGREITLAGISLFNAQAEGSDQFIQYQAILSSNTTTQATASFDTSTRSNLAYVMVSHSNINIPVPEPSTLAIFALGMIGLASRRFKKQS
ncbi:PEP-CTERM sorting domain-containing protein [Colwellia sp. MSW7]|uniref:PEP-CTERM sorting domain-containing protein n=1 Tax=Colwellia maritima TaxID=2912588 RepID=A0ABS9X7J5_9GAMM|nr:PEP-CTERM sorting domain-containing protein [Colwellia maritima]MCI2286210.1 PEP-CTERM sorting domain-containing protein [Colwellia maritima]